MPAPASANTVTAAVVRTKGGPFMLEQLRLEEPRADEVLVRIVATGMCHTDMVVRDQVYPVPQPIVLGHEGAGVVEKIGGNVVKVKPGDHVVLSFMSCGRCRFCERADPTTAKRSTTTISAAAARTARAACRTITAASTIISLVSRRSARSRWQTSATSSRCRKTRRSNCWVRLAAACRPAPAR